MAWEKIATSVKSLGEHLSALSEDALFAGTSISAEDRSAIAHNLQVLQNLVDQTDNIVLSYLQGITSDR